MNRRIRQACRRRGISRLCHFTPTRNLVHIVTGSGGLLSTQRLNENERSAFNPTDLQRLDGFPDHVCCSIQYPNPWYFDAARRRERLFPDWVVLLIDPRCIWQDGTKFSVGNAATGMGGSVREGLDAFDALFEPEVHDARGHAITRGRKPDSLPTNDQAEVLVSNQVDRDALLGVAVKDEAQARRESARFTALGQSLPILVAPDLFRKRRLSNMLRAGRLPVESEFRSGAPNG